MTWDAANRRAKEAAEALGEHFDNVLIIATWSENDATEIVHQWSGDYYAAKGMAREFLRDESDRLQEEDDE